VAAVLLVDAGLATILVGLCSLLKPISFLGISSRFSGLVVFCCGLFLVVAGFLLPVGETRIDSPRTQLDAFAPVYQFHEFHSIRVAAPREKVFLAVQQVTPKEIFSFQTLTWIRRFGREERESILNPPPNQPILDVAARTGFLKLAEERNTEVVFGTLVVAPRGWRFSGSASPEKYRSLDGPGFAKAAINFHIENCDSTSCFVVTETRVQATDISTVRKFAPYWRTIYPGSTFIRRMWLRAIRKRAEALPS
jgi:hypothetical protein